MSVVRIIKISFRIQCCDNKTGEVDWKPEEVIREIAVRKKYFRKALNMWVDRNWNKVLSKVKRDGNKECYDTFHSGEKGTKGEHRLKLCGKSVKLIDSWEEIE